MFVLSLLKKTAQATEYYFDDFKKADDVLHQIRLMTVRFYFTDDYGHAGTVDPSKVVEATVIDVEKRKLAVHECKMVADYANLKINKLTMDDPRTAEIVQAQKPLENTH